MYLIYLKLFLLFLFWRLGLFAVASLSIYFLPQFGARFPYYQAYLMSEGLPFWIWGFGNFDGVYYISIAKNGYIADYTQVFFPLFPILIWIFNFLGSYLLTGLFLSNFFLFIAICLLFKLFNYDFDTKTSYKSIILLLSFPTAFYLGSLYAESLLILLTVIFFLFFRKGKFIMAGLIAGIATCVKIFAVILTIVLIFELSKKMISKEIFFKSKEFYYFLISICLSFSGLAFYMIYLYINFNDPLYFLNSQPVFGAERSNLPIITLPQVIFRYIKILITVPANSLLFFNSMLELIMTVIPLCLLLVLYKKINLSYRIFILGCMILPTLTGTLSSMPRYALMSFLLFPVTVQSLGRYYKITILSLLTLQTILLILFIRGYWIA